MASISRKLLSKIPIIVIESCDSEKDSYSSDEYREYDFDYYFSRGSSWDDENDRKPLLESSNANDLVDFNESEIGYQNQLYNPYPTAHYDFRGCRQDLIDIQEDIFPQKTIIKDYNGGNEETKNMRTLLTNNII